MNSWFDCKYAFRRLGNSPAFASLTTLIIALGIGLCIVTYSTIYTIAFKPLPLPDGARMFAIALQDNGQRDVDGFDHLALREFSGQQTVFEVFGYYQPEYVNVSTAEHAKYYQAVHVSQNVFEYTSTYPMAGRAFTALDMQQHAQPVVIISYSLWQNYLGGQADIIGNTINVEGQNREVIGIMPDGFLFPHAHHLWMPLPSRIDPQDEFSERMYGKLKADISVKEALAELNAIYRKLQLADPERLQTTTVALSDWPSSQVEGLEPIFFAMLSAVFLILCLACINVANLLYARAHERLKETAIRSALGAPTLRLIMQMMWESIIICSIGGSIAILGAQLGLEIVRKVLSGFYVSELPFYWQFTVDPHIAPVSLLLIVCAAVVTGLVPAWKILSNDLNQTLLNGTRGAQSRGSGKVSNAIVVFQILVACALLTSSAMISIAIHQAETADYGFDSDNMLTAVVKLPEADYPTDTEKKIFINALLESLNAQPDVDFATAAVPLPGMGGWYREVTGEDFEKAATNRYPRTYSANVMHDTLEKLDIQLVAGRHFEESDNASSQKVAIVTTSFVEQILTRRTNVIGQQISFVHHALEPEPETMTIIGVVEHVILGDPTGSRKSRPSVFMPLPQQQQKTNISVVLKGVNKPALELIDTFNRSLRSLNKNLPAINVQSYDESLRGNTEVFSFLARLFELFAAVALVLATAGIYGVVAKSVSLRTHEIGIRRAVGASDKHIILMLMKKGWAQLLPGLAIGLPIAYLLGKTLLTLIGGDSVAVYAMYILIPAIIVMVVSLATYIPAKRAVDSEPTAALRYE